MNRDREYWACALEVERQHGAGAALFVAARIGELVLAGDVAGVERWKAIAARLQDLIAGRARGDRTYPL